MSAWLAGYHDFISDSCVAEQVDKKNKWINRLSINARNLKSCKLSWSQLSFLQKCGKLVTSSASSVERIKDCTYLDEECFLLTDCSEIFHKGREDEERKVKVNEGDNTLMSKVKVNGDDKTFSSIDSTDKILILQKLDDTSSLVRIDITPAGKDCSNSRFTYSIAKPITIGKVVTQVSCGKEHILLRIETGQIYSFGGGSRGQLGHGSVENLESPKLVEGLIGVTMLTMAAGGWHSMAVSDLGDLYAWGWNESGQLGLPCRTHHRKSTPMQTFSDKNSASSSSTSNSSSTLSSHMFDPSKAQDNTEEKFPINTPGTDVGSREVGTCSYKKDEIVSEESHCSDLCEPDPLESQVLIQDTGAVQVQSEPCIVDFGDVLRVKKAACGSRHTVILTENNTVLSTGWNDYGQLCQGDTDSRDFFESVNFFRKLNLRVTDVYAGAWSTVFIVDNQCN